MRKKIQKRKQKEGGKNIHALDLGIEPRIFCMLANSHNCCLDKSGFHGYEQAWAIAPSFVDIVSKRVCKILHV